MYELFYTNQNIVVYVILVSLFFLVKEQDRLKQKFDEYEKKIAKIEETLLTVKGAVKELCEFAGEQTIQIREISTCMTSFMDDMDTDIIELEKMIEQIPVKKTLKNKGKKMD